jgi:hypothetical protein
MTVVVNEAALDRLFHSEPIRREVEEVARVVERGVVSKLTDGEFALLADYHGDVDALIGISIESDPQTVFAAVGVVDTGQRLARYIKFKEDRDHRWFQAVLDEMRM